MHVWWRRAQVFPALAGWKCKRVPFFVAKMNWDLIERSVCTRVSDQAGSFRRCSWNSRTDHRAALRDRVKKKKPIIEIILSYLHCFWPRCNRSAFTKISAENKNMKKELMLKKEKYVPDFFLFDICTVTSFISLNKKKKTLWINSLALPIWNIHANVV